MRLVCCRACSIRHIPSASLPPSPLDTPLAVTRQDKILMAEHEGLPILTARPGGVTLTPPLLPPPLRRARKAAETPTYFGAGGVSTCFVCGRNRKEGEGLHIHCGRLGDRLEAAAVWTPHANFDDGHGYVRPEYVWAALDCPRRLRPARDRDDLPAGGDGCGAAQSRPRPASR
jgi:hypothetical protein